MQGTISDNDIKSQPIPQADAKPVDLEPKPSLDAVKVAICLDAQYDSLKFVLRSDTGHDGE